MTKPTTANQDEQDRHHHHTKTTTHTAAADPGTAATAATPAADHNTKPTHYMTHSQLTHTTKQGKNTLGSPAAIFTRPDFLKRHPNRHSKAQPHHNPLTLKINTDHAALAILSGPAPSSLPRSGPSIFPKNPFGSESPLLPILSSRSHAVQPPGPPILPNSPNTSIQSTMTFSTTSSTKPIIHHITSPATLSTLHPNPSLLSLPKSSDPSTDSTQQNHSAISGGLVLKPGDVWSQVVLRVIPLFNGEGHKGFIEDLNDFVSQHIHKTIADSPSKSINKLYSDITELFANGVMILNNKLQPDQLSDERLLVRVFEVWHFFFTGVLPYLEAIFLPLMSDENLLNVIESKNNKDLQERLQQQHLLQQATTNAHLFSSTSPSLWLRQSNRNPQNPSQHQSTGSHSSRTEEVIQEIDIRKLALLAFRQHLCLPIFSRLYKLFTMLYDSTTWKKLYGRISISSDVQSEHMHLKRLQMVGLLSSLQSKSPQQPMMQELSKLIRLKKANPDLLKPPSTTSLQNVPLRAASANKNNSITKSTNNEVDNVPDRDPSSPFLSHLQQQISLPSSTFTIPSTSKVDSTNQYDDDGGGGGDQPFVNILQDENPSQLIKGFNKNRDFARRSIRRQLSRSGATSRAARENHQPRYDQEHHQQQPQQLEENSDSMGRKPERRIRRNHRATQQQSISRVLEDDTSIHNRSPPILPTSQASLIVFSTQRPPSLDEASRSAATDGEHTFEHLNDNAHFVEDQKDQWSLGHRRRMVFGQKTGSGSSSGSIMSLMGAQTKPPSYHHQINNNRSMVNSKSTSVDELLDHTAISFSSTLTRSDPLSINSTKPLVFHHKVKHSEGSSSASNNLHLNIQPLVHSESPPSITPATPTTTTTPNIKKTNNSRLSNTHVRSLSTSHLFHHLHNGFPS